MVERPTRFSDGELVQLRKDFESHIEDGKKERQQQDELYAAIFQKEDEDANTPAGLLQMMARVNKQLQDMQKWQDRQKTFVGGVVFTISSAWFFISDVGPKLLVGLKKFMS